VANITATTKYISGKKKRQHLPVNFWIVKKRQHLPVNFHDHKKAATIAGTQTLKW
jgi:hypothetical protein